MNRRKIGMITAVIVLALTLNGCGNSTNESSADDVIAADNQRLAYAVVTAIEGNEMTYMEVEESQLNLSSDEDSANTDEEQSGTTDEAAGTSAASDAQQSGGSEPPEGAPSMDDASGMEGAPSMDDASGMDGAPSMDDAAGMEGAPSMDGAPSEDGSTGTEASGMDRSQMKGNGGGRGNMMSESGTESMMPMEEGSTEGMTGGFDKSNMTGTSTTVQIPVGVTVHTTNDTNTTFSRIVSGDILKLLFETDEEGNEVIVEIWMVQ